MNRKKISKAAIRRQVAEIKDRYKPRDLPPKLQAMLDDYRPTSVDTATFEQVKPTMHDIMRRTRTTGVEKFRQQRGYVTQLAAWSFANGLSLDLEQMLTVERINGFISRGCPNASDATRADKRSDLLELARQVNPAYDGLPRSQQISRPRVKPPYTAQEVAVIVRVARNQNTAGRRRRLSAICGLGLGAGLDSTDLKPLRARHIHDRGEDGIVVEVGGRRPRAVPVREEYEDLVRAGIDGLRPNDLVIGRKPTRKDVAGRVVADAVIPSTAPHIEQGRLRATYLAALIQQPIPVLDVLEAAGLKSVQTLVDIAKHLREEQEGGR